MSKIAYIKIFNDILDQFFNYLEDEFTYFKSDIILTKNSIAFIRKSNPRLVVEQFMEYTLPYSKQIFECDEDFFLNFENNINGIDEENMLFGLKLKSFWMSQENNNGEKSLRQKAIIFHFFQKLLKAGKII